MADDKVTDDVKTEETPAAEAPAEPEVAQEDVSKEAAEPTAETAEAVVADPVEDTYESVAAPVEKAEPEKTNGTAAAAAATAETIEVPLDENEAAAQPLTGGDKDVEGGATTSDVPKEKSPLRVHERLLRTLRKREILFPVIGGVTFLLGLILIITGLLVMQGKCDRQGAKATNGDGHLVAMGKTSPEDDDHVRYADNSHMLTHNHNSSVDEGELENLAAGRPTYQSSTAYSDEGVYYNSSLAVDGNTGASMSKGECAQTEKQASPEWNVDLESDQVVKRVKIIIPSNCCVGELHNFNVRVGSDLDLTQNAKCKHFMGTALRTVITMDCDTPLTGRYVSIHVQGEDARRDRLSLCEVMVY